MIDIVLGLTIVSLFLAGVTGTLIVGGSIVVLWLYNGASTSDYALLSLLFLYCASWVYPLIFGIQSLFLRLTTFFISIVGVLFFSESLAELMNVPYASVLDYSIVVSLLSVSCLGTLPFILYRDRMPT